MFSKNYTALIVISLSFLFILSCKKPTEPSEIGGPCPDMPTVTYAGKVYNTVQIGNQCWLKENLDVGTRIDVTENQTDNGIIEKYCYDNNDTNCDTYGGLYQWDEAMQYSTVEGAQGICPPGWHIPTLEEYNTLVDAVGGNANALKAIGQGTGSGAGTNTSGFSVLLAGFRKGDSTYSYIDSGAAFWISTESSADCSWGPVLRNDRQDVDFSCYYKDMGFSVRCIKD